jgi:hypothetical protein
MEKLPIQFSHEILLQIPENAQFLLKGTNMTTISASFEIARTFDPRAAVKWLDRDNSAVPNSDAFRQALKTRADHLFHEDCGDLACWWLVLSDKNVIAETAALADKAGFVVAETADGWTAIEPDAELWSDMPGAFFRWTAEISTFETECSEVDVLWINRSSIADEDAIAIMQDVLGWRVAIRKTRDAIKITYTHSDKIAA